MKFNINDYVKVRLTSEGFIQHHVYWHKLGLQKYGHTYERPETDAEGYSRFQLWELMHIFGPECWNGSDQMFVDNIVVIP